MNKVIWIVMVIILSGLSSFSANGQAEIQAAERTLAQLGIEPTFGSYHSLSEDSKLLDMSGKTNHRSWEILLSEEYSDFVLETKVRIDSDGTDDECGLLFRRANENNYYSLTIDRQHGLYFYEKFRDSPIWSYGSGGDVDSERNRENTLTIVAIGSEFYVYVNQRFAATFYDDSITKGSFGIVGITWKDSITSRCSFRETWLWVPNEDFPMIVAPNVPSPELAVREVVATHDFELSGSLIERWNYHQIDLTGYDNYLSWNYFAEVSSQYIVQTQVQWGIGASEDSCGVLINHNNETDFSVVSISPDGLLRFQSVIDGEWQDSDSRLLTSINMYEMARNTITVLASDSGVEVSVNDSTFHHFQLPQDNGRNVALFAETGNTSDVTSCTFRHSWLWDLDSVYAPRILSPSDGSVYSRYPRLVNLVWESIPNADHFTVEIQYAYDGSWSGDYILQNTTDNMLEFTFVGAQPGRWRVWAVMDDGTESEKSDWHSFAFTQ